MKKDRINKKVIRCRKNKFLSKCRLYQKYPINIPYALKKRIYFLFDEFANKAKEKNTNFRYGISRNEIDYAIYAYFFEILNKMRNSEIINISGLGKFYTITKMTPQKKYKTIKIVEEKIPKFEMGRIKKHINNQINDENTKQFYQKRIKYIQNYEKTGDKSSIFREYLGFDI